MYLGLSPPQSPLKVKPQYTALEEIALESSALGSNENVAFYEKAFSQGRAFVTSNRRFEPQSHP